MSTEELRPLVVDPEAALPLQPQQAQVREDTETLQVARRRSGRLGVARAVFVGLGVSLVAVGAMVALTRWQGEPTGAAGDERTELMYPFKNKTGAGAGANPCAPVAAATTTPKAPGAPAPAPAPAPAAAAPCATVAPGAAPVAPAPAPAPVPAPAPSAPAPSAPAPAPVAVTLTVPKGLTTLAPLGGWTTPLALTTCPPLDPCSPVASGNLTFGTNYAAYHVANKTEVSPAFQAAIAKAAGVKVCDVAITDIQLATSARPAGGRRLQAGNIIVFFTMIAKDVHASVIQLLFFQMKEIVQVTNRLLAHMGLIARVGIPNSFGIATTTGAIGGATTTEKDKGLEPTTTRAGGGGAPEPEPEPETGSEEKLLGVVPFDVPADTKLTATPEVQKAFEAGIAAGAGVSPSDVTVTGASTSPPGSSRRLANVITWYVKYEIILRRFIDPGAFATMMASAAATIASSTTKGLNRLSYNVVLTITKPLTVTTVTGKQITAPVSAASTTGGAAATTAAAGATTAAAGPTTAAPGATTAATTAAATTAATTAAETTAAATAATTAAATTAAATAATTVATTAAATTAAADATTAAATTAKVASPEPEPEPEN